MQSNAAPMPVAVGDTVVRPEPADSVSELCFSPVADLLAATSWDNQLRVWDVSGISGTTPKAGGTHEQPALTCTWTHDGSRVISGGADKQIRILDMATGQSTAFPAHDAAVKSCRWISSTPSPVLATASFDKTIKYWDLRQPQPVGQVQLPDRCYGMDATYPLLVAITAEKNVVIINLTNPFTIFASAISPLKHQLKSVSCRQDGQTFALGAIDGRVRIENLMPGTGMFTDKTGFAFRAHKNDQLVYPVNSISFNNAFGTMSTAGSDGVLHYWDYNNRSRLKTLSYSMSTASSPSPPITSTAFDRTFQFQAYAVGYDWYQGHEKATRFPQKGIFIHKIGEDMKSSKFKKSY